MRILIIKLGALGDVVRTMSALPALKDKYPQAVIDWLTAANAAEFFIANKYIEHLYFWEDKPQLNEYDLVINLEDSREVCEYATKINTQKVVGTYLRNNIVTYTPSPWFDMSLVSKHGKEKADQLKKENTTTYQQHLYDLLDLPKPINKPELTLTDKDQQDIQHFKKQYNIRDIVIGINTGAGTRWRYKRWGTSETIELIHTLQKTYPESSILLFGGKEEADRNQFIQKNTNAILVNTPSLRNLLSYISICTVLVTSDSLALHLATAFQTKIVAFFGPTPASEIDLYNQGTKLETNLECKTCYLNNCDKTLTCMDTITVDVVLEAILKLNVHLTLD